MFYASLLARADGDGLGICGRRGMQDVAAVAEGHSLGADGGAEDFRSVSGDWG